MKKSSHFIILLAIAILSAILIICPACDSAWGYNNQTVVDGIVLNYNKTSKKAYAAYFIWDGDRNNMEFTVPDKYNGYNVTRLGEIGRPGFCGYQVKFGVSLPEKIDDYDVLSQYVNAPDTATAENTFILEFIVNIGKYVNTVEKLRNDNLYACGVKGDEENIIEAFCRVKIYYNIDSDNATFYSKDGDLYYKSNDQKVEYVPF